MQVFRDASNRIFSKSHTCCFKISLYSAMSHTYSVYASNQCYKRKKVHYICEHIRIAAVSTQLLTPGLISMTGYWFFNNVSLYWCWYSNYLPGVCNLILKRSWLEEISNPHPFTYYLNVFLGHKYCNAKPQLHFFPTYHLTRQKESSVKNSSI